MATVFETDSVLAALLPRLNGGFDRTLLCIIADRYDDIELGRGDGWRVLWEFAKKPYNYGECVYWALSEGGGYEGYLPLIFGNLLWTKRDYYGIVPKEYSLKKILSVVDGYCVDFSSCRTAYVAAAESWSELTPEQQEQCRGLMK